MMLISLKTLIIMTSNPSWLHKSTHASNIFFEIILATPSNTPTLLLSKESRLYPLVSINKINFHEFSIFQISCGTSYIYYISHATLALEFSWFLGGGAPTAPNRCPSSSLGKAADVMLGSGYTAYCAW